jgi:hypothetical protein
VRQHLGCGIEHLAEPCGARVEIRDEQLYTGAGIEQVDLPDGLGVQPGTTVGQIVTGHTGDGGVAQPHCLH